MGGILEEVHGGGGDPNSMYAGTPAWLGGLLAQQESVRAFDLPSLNRK